MKDNEIKFFTMCIYAFVLKKENKYYVLSVRDLIEIIQQIIPYKQCLYYLDKWTGKGFYSYGVSLSLGYLEPREFKGEYKKIYDEILLNEKLIRR